MAYRDRRELIPSPLSPVFPATPPQASQWRTSLSYVQWLFLKGQYKRTIMEARQLLTNPFRETAGLVTTYLCFYAALAAEALARLAHPLSLTRMESLELAKQYYETAKTVLPSPAVSCELEDEEQGLQIANDSNDGVTGSDTASVGDHEQSVTRTRYSASSIQSDNYIADTLFPRPPSVYSPSPSSVGDDDALARQKEDEGLSSPAPARQSNSSESRTYQARQQSLEYTSTWLKNKSVDLFNNHLQEFRALLIKHLVTIDLLIDSTKESRSLRHTTGRLEGFGDDEEAKLADRKHRLQRLKANGWARERFRPEYYAEVRERAMADLLK